MNWKLCHGVVVSGSHWNVLKHVHTTPRTSPELSLTAVKWYETEEWQKLVQVCLEQIALKRWMPGFLWTDPYLGSRYLEIRGYRRVLSVWVSSSNIKKLDQKKSYRSSRTLVWLFSSPSLPVPQSSNTEELMYFWYKVRVYIDFLFVCLFADLIFYTLPLHLIPSSFSSCWVSLKESKWTQRLSTKSSPGAILPFSKGW